MKYFNINGLKILFNSKYVYFCCKQSVDLVDLIFLGLVAFLELGMVREFFSIENLFCKWY